MISERKVFLTQLSMPAGIQNRIMAPLDSDKRERMQRAYVSTPNTPVGQIFLTQSGRRTPGEGTRGQLLSPSDSPELFNRCCWRARPGRLHRD